MKKCFIAICVLFIAVQVTLAETPAAAPNEQIAKFEANIEKLIVTDHNLSAALKEYVDAAKANPQEVYYRQQYAVLQRVIKMQTLLTTEMNLEKWKSYAKAVRGYFYSKGFYSEALPLDLKAANKFDTADYAANVVETMLLTGKTADAAKFLAGKKPADSSVRYQTLALTVQALDGKAKEAVDALQAVKIDPKMDSKSYLDAARIYNAAGDNAKTLSNLQLLLENTLPSEIAAERIMIAKTADFAALQTADDFKKVVATASKIQQSSCTGGSNCATCKSRDKCASQK